MEDEDFEEQLKQEALQKLKEEEGNDKTYKDGDGMEYEWDEEKKAWFPKITEDFIAQYQMNYGSNTADTQDSESGQDYYNYYYHREQQSTAGSQNESESKNEECESAINKGTDDVENKKSENSKNESESNSTDGLQSLEGLDVNSEEYYRRYHEYYSYYYGEDYANYYNYYNQEEIQGEVQSEGKGQNDGQRGKKRKKKGEKAAVPPPKREEGWFDVEKDKNTNVYVSGLPSDITQDEFKELMNKCGLVMFDPHTKQPKLKLYLDEEGNPKGDGRCCYIKVESVDLAMKILDGYKLRGSTVHVERAHFTMKGQFDPTKKKKKLTNKQKRKFQEKQQKLFDWRPEKKLDLSRPKCERIVVLKNMFDPKEFETDPTLINDLRDDTRSECSKLGEVKNIRLFDNHPEGVITVTMKTAEEADEVIKVLNGRWFAKKKVSAEAWDGKTKYEIEESEAERENRLKKWGSFLEGEDKSKNTSENKDVTSTGTDSTMDLTEGTEVSSEIVQNTSTVSSESTTTTCSDQQDSKSIETLEVLGNNDNNSDSSKDVVAASKNENDKNG